MKWENKLHEFDEEAKAYHDDNFQSKKIFIFGAGQLGKEFFEQVKSVCILDSFIDNDKKKQGTTYCGRPVISLQQYLSEKNTNALIVLCLKKEYYQVVKEQLKKNSIQEEVSFVDRDEYIRRLRISLFYEKGILYIPLAQISLTERCTLKCKKCAHACNFVRSNAADLSLQDAKVSADYFFSYVDYIDEFVLIGGEPFLYNNLGEIIEYIGSHYRDKIRIFSITTNGTILPKSNILKLCSEYNMTIRVSNYSETLPWIAKKLEEFSKAAKVAGVKCIIGKSVNWTDYGFDYYSRGWNKKNMQQAFDDCNTPCHEVRKNRFYFCVMARSVSENMGKDVGLGDFFDLSAREPMFDRKEFFEYSMGYSEKGYLDMCNFCHGADRVNYPVPAGEQMSING